MFSTQEEIYRIVYRLNWIWLRSPKTRRMRKFQNVPVRRKRPMDWWDEMCRKMSRRILDPRILALRQSLLQNLRKMFRWLQGLWQTFYWDMIYTKPDSMLKSRCIYIITLYRQLRQVNYTRPRKLYQVKILFMKLLSRNRTQKWFIANYMISEQTVTTTNRLRRFSSPDSCPSSYLLSRPYGQIIYFFRIFWKRNVTFLWYSRYK